MVPWAALATASSGAHVRCPAMVVVLHHWPGVSIYWLFAAVVLPSHLSIFRVWAGQIWPFADVDSGLLLVVRLLSFIVW